MNTVFVPQPLSPRFRHQGTTLVELMIAITIGLLILAALSVMYVNQTGIRRELDKNNRMTDNGRYAIQMLNESFKHAGFYGEYSPAAATTPTAMDPCDSTKFFESLKLPVQAIHAVNLGSKPDLSATTCGLSASMLKEGSDVIVVRRVETNVTPLASVGGGFFLQSSLCSTDTAEAKLASTSSALDLHQKPTAGGACTTVNPETRRLVVQMYFVSPFNIPGDGIPTLKRLELMPGGTVLPAGTVNLDGTKSTASNTLSGTGAFVVTPLVEGVEFMKIDYGIDSDNTDGKGLADSYTSSPACPISGAGSCAEASNVVDLNVYLLVRNLEKTTGHVDQKYYQMGLTGAIAPSALDTAFKRQVYKQYVRLTNPAGRRETP